MIPAWPILVEYVFIWILLVYVYIRNHSTHGKQLAVTLLLPVAYLIYAYCLASFTTTDVFVVRDIVRVGNIVFNFVLFVVLYRLLAKQWAP